MASIHATTSSILSSFLPRLTPAKLVVATRSTALYSRQFSHPLLPTFAIPSAIHLNVPGFLEGLWESILKAVPKKKTSHMKKRHRQMAGKALKDVTNLNRCSSCGHIKRAHLLCPYCVHEIQNRFRRKGDEVTAESKDTNLTLKKADELLEEAKDGGQPTEMQK